MTVMKGASSSSCDISSEAFLRLSMFAKMGEWEADESPFAETLFFRAKMRG
jgi:hypothetical protein